MVGSRLVCLIVIGAMVGWVRPASGEGRFFTYSYQAEVATVGELEFEQHVTNQSSKQHGDYSRWDFRSEVEYGVSEHYQSALYLNLKSVHNQGTGTEEDGSEFEGISWENIYQLMNPDLDPIGVALYGEGTSDGNDHELEWKLILSKPLGSFELAANTTYEMEWDNDDSHTEREGGLEFTLGAAYRVTPALSFGIEARNKSAYPGGLNLAGQEYQAWSVGPNLHYQASTWWITLTALPQVWGNGDGSQGGRQLMHEERAEFRAIIGMEY